MTKIYQLTNSYPKEEIFGLTNQMIRASVSISSNIAEGAARNSKKEFIQFLYIALGSNQELDTQLLISRNLEFISEENYNNTHTQIQTVGKLLNGLIKYLKTNDK